MKRTKNIACALSLLALGGCGSDSAPSPPLPDACADESPKMPKTLACGASELFAVVHDQCAAMDVRGEGDCYCTSMGWVWDGSTCVQLDAGHCNCVGEDCDKLAETEQDCLANHAACLPKAKTIACGDTALFEKVHEACAKMDVRGNDDCFCTSMGWAWDGTTCVQLDAGHCNCVGEDCDKLTDTEQACLANHVACSPSEKSISCGDSALFEGAHTACPAMDVRGDGMCNCTSMGWTWNGSVCVQMKAGYCKCLGDDCDKLSATEQDCLSSHASCL